MKLAQVHLAQRELLKIVFLDLPPHFMSCLTYLTKNVCPPVFAYNLLEKKNMKLIRVRFIHGGDNCNVDFHHTW